MAPLLDSVAVARVSALPIAASCASGSVVSGRRMSPARFLEFKGLKIKPSLVTRSVGSVSQVLNRRSGVARGGRIVCEAQDTASAAAVEVPNITESEWQSLVLESEIPALVEFWAPWCGPCRMIHPIVDQLAKEFKGKLKFYKINTDECPNIASQYGIRSIPTVMVFKAGEKKESVIGAVPKETLEKSIEKFL